MKEKNQKMNKDNCFNQKEYKKNYNKSHYKTFKVDLKIEEKEELDKLLKHNKLTSADFLRNAITNLKNKKD